MILILYWLLAVALGVVNCLEAVALAVLCMLRITKLTWVIIP